MTDIKMSDRMEMVPITDIKPYKRNPRNNTEAIPKVAESIQRFGFRNPIILDKDNVVIAGHTRLMAAKKLGIKEVPCIWANDLTPDEVKALRLVDNKTAEYAEWELDLLNDELNDINLDLSAFDFDIDMATDDEPIEVQEDDFDEETETNEHGVKQGDIWQLGRHRLMCGDSTSKTEVDKLTSSKKMDLVFTDPPYGMKKENEGVLNDNLNFDDLLAFNKKWIPLTFNALKDNGSWYCWGIDEPLMDIYSNILKPMQKQNKITFRNLLTWDKGDAGAGGVSFMGKDGLRSYPISDEKCLFVMCGVQGFNNNADNYDEVFEPIRSYMESEAKKVGLTPNKLKEICGVGMYSHWFTKSQFAIITREHYTKLQHYYKNDDAFTMSYDELKDLFDSDIIMAKRAYFDNTHDKMKTVWEFGRVKGAEREECGDHATPKPIALCSRAIISSSREGESVMDLFGGSGSTLIACEQTNRQCYMMELDPHYCDVIISRWEKLTGQQAVKVS